MVDLLPHRRLPALSLAPPGTLPVLTNPLYVAEREQFLAQSSANHHHITTFDLALCKKMIWLHNYAYLLAGSVQNSPPRSGSTAVLAAGLKNEESSIPPFRCSAKGYVLQGQAHGRVSALEMADRGRSYRPCTSVQYGTEAATRLGNR